jgi:hypothetical protein
MSYTPINDDAFIAAFSGAIASMAASGYLFQTSAANYANQVAIAGAFAQAFDTAWADAAVLTTLEQRTMTTVCEQNFREHMGQLTQSNLVIPATWTVTANAIVALILECGVYFTAQGIPEEAGSGSGALLRIQGSTYAVPLYVSVDTGEVQVGSWCELDGAAPTLRYEAVFQATVSALAGYIVSPEAIIEASVNNQAWIVVARSTFENLKNGTPDPDESYSQWSTINTRIPLGDFPLVLTPGDNVRVRALVRVANTNAPNNQFALCVGNPIEGTDQPIASLTFAEYAAS